MEKLTISSLETKLLQAKAHLYVTIPGEIYIGGATMVPLNGEELEKALSLVLGSRSYNMEDVEFVSEGIPFDYGIRKFKFKCPSCGKEHIVEFDVRFKKRELISDINYCSKCGVHFDWTEAIKILKC